MPDKIITHEILKSWSPCVEGYKRFCELFPNGATLKEAMEGLAADGNDNWGFWLFTQCQERDGWEQYTLAGYRNSGDWNSGNYNSGDYNSGNCNSGDWNSGYRNSGDYNSGYRNSGDCNSSNWNSGNCNSGDWNSGYRNSGDYNSGNCNSGDWNSGYRNSGDYNSGNWNSGNCNSGFFNSETPEDVLVFNKPCKRSVWDKADKPYLLYFELTCWVSEDEMTDAEKASDPGFFVLGGQLRKRDYKEAFKLSYDAASAEDKAKLLKLPNFDADVFFDISGIRVEEA